MKVWCAVLQNALLGIPLVRRLAAKKHVTGIDGDPARAAELFAFWQSFGPVAGARILELGPGKTLEVLQLARRAGAAACAAVDIVRYHDPGAARRAGIDYRVYSGEALPFAEASFDLVWASYCLQHVRAPVRVVAEIARVLAPGGALVCRVDLRDHYHMFDAGRQYECLRHGERLWRLMTSNRGSYVNRLRCSDWQRTFAAAGLVAEQVVPHHDAELLRQNRAHEYLRTLHDDDLRTYRFDGRYRRPQA